jgi:1-acylglycerone phosphate reductase
MAALSSKGIETISLEVTSEQSIQSCFEHVQKATNGQGLDMLINNAGISYTVPALDVKIDDVRQLFETNVFAVMLMCQTFFPLLMAAKGTIVMIGSVTSAMPYVWGSAYNASKGAMLQYANTLRVEVAPFDVKVISVIAGGVSSQLSLQVARTLPKDSLYAPIPYTYQTRLRHSATVGVTPDAFAEDVVPQIVPGGGPWLWRLFLKDARKRWIWAGGQSGRVWFLSGGWFWHGLFDWFFSRKFKLVSLASKAKSA